jgi:glycosyltransferase involved in cell wall biosynthesis
MRILFLSAFYPPFGPLGWPQKVQELDRLLQARGHTTQVLTSSYGVQQRNDGETESVRRVLSLESDLLHYRHSSVLAYGWRARRNVAEVESCVRAFGPDVVFIHVMWNLSPRLAWCVEQLLPGRVVYYMADHWAYTPDVHTAYWNDPARRPLRRWLKRMAAPLALGRIERWTKVPLHFDRVLCVSHSIRDRLIRQAGVSPENAAVVYYGIDTQRFSPASHRDERSAFSLLYAGRVASQKGVRTAVEAVLGTARNASRAGDVSLTIVGSGDPEYIESLQQLAHGAPIHFRPAVPYEAMPDLLRGFDALVLPSIWEEPLAGAMLEAMASGVLVIGTTTGGSGEALVDGETGLTFPPGDAELLARQIAYARDHPEMCLSLARRAREVVVQRFDIQRMVSEIERELLRVVQSRLSGPPDSRVD